MNVLVMDHRTSESWAWASERAQRRRYDAVFEIHPRQYSIVSAAKVVSTASH